MAHNGFSKINEYRKWIKRIKAEFGDNAEAVDSGDHWIIDLCTGRYPYPPYRTYKVVGSGRTIRDAIDNARLRIRQTKEV